MNKGQKIKELYEKLDKIENEIAMLDGKKLILMGEASDVRTELDELGEEIFF